MADQLYGLNDEQIRRLKRLLEAFEAGSLLNSQNQRPATPKTPIETYLAKTKEDIPGLATGSGSGSGSGSGVSVASGQVALVKWQSGSLVEAGINETAYNAGRGSVGSGGVVQLHRDPYTGKLFFDNGQSLQKAELIDHLWQGQTSSSRAWLLRWTGSEWERTEQEIDVYGDQGTRGMGFGRTDDVDRGDYIDIVFNTQAQRYYGVGNLGQYFHATYIGSAGSGSGSGVGPGGTEIVQLAKGAGSDERLVDVLAYNPYEADLQADDFVAVNWNDFSVHWDIEKSAKVEPGCGLKWVSHGSGSGGGPKTLDFNPTDVAGDGLEPGSDDPEDCTLKVKAGCGVTVTAAGVGVNADQLAGTGLKAGSGSCELEIDCEYIRDHCAVVPEVGCGLWITPEEKLEVAHDELAGKGLVIGDNCELDANLGAGLKFDPNEAITIDPGCGLWLNGEKLEVAHDELAGDGLVIGSNCELDVNAGPGLIIDGSNAVAVDPGCGIWINAGKVEVAHDELAGNGLVIGANCQLDIDCQYIKDNCAVLPDAGCGLYYPTDGTLAVAHDELAGDGLVIGNDCAIDVNAGPGLIIDGSNSVAVNPGCGIWINAGKVEVAHDELAGNGLVIGSNCQLDIDCQYIKDNCGTLPEAGCGIWYPTDGTIAVAHDELAGPGLTIGNNCELEVQAGTGIIVNSSGVSVDCQYVRDNCSAMPNPGCGIWYPTTGTIAVAQDELAGNGLTVGSNCQLDVMAGCGIQVDSSGVAVNASELAGDGLQGTGCELSVRPGCGIWINGGAIEVAHDELAGNGLTVGSNCQLDVMAGPGITVDSSGVSIDCQYIKDSCQIQGEQGEQGYQGDRGEQGYDGRDGYQGTQGPQGYQGNQGAQGEQGYDGERGFQGHQGNQGRQGNQGNQGNQGAQGHQGAQGPQGIQGAQGSQGAQAAQGSQGYDGERGFQGQQGQQGNQGRQGSQGNQGAQGSQGHQGSQGSQGFMGNQGPQGQQGSQGSQGQRGDNGLQGQQGSQGEKGEQGDQGEQGSQGDKGDKGDKGDNGQQGGSGPQGPPGIGSQSPGPQGPQGAAGPQGPPGYQGFQSSKTAIVPTRNANVALFCVESPEVRFTDYMKVYPGAMTDTFTVDPTFVEVCEPNSIEVVALVTPVLCKVAGEVQGGVLYIQTDQKVPYVMASLSGIRRGHITRFPWKTTEEMYRNDSFWRQSN